ncbi:MAG TPA: hypothetical protein PLH91_09880 [Tenuifilaceae bacterium]|nr:hypothetical protein [Tenuifilaceae bacterium]HPI45529.1 hypothetical protein [Tenuifilaceae bacterium]HPN21637.1 hypothetical protein [Tenuifilaceae bacterium]
MKRIFVFVFGMVTALYSFSQKYKVYKDNHLFGLKEISSDKIVITPKYKRIYNFRDSLFLVMNTLEEESIIDINENILVPFKKTSTGIIEEPTDSSIDGKFCEFSQIKLKNSLITYVYQIDENRNCIPNEYAPCPLDKTVNYNNRDPYFKLIQNSIQHSSLGKIDSAIYESKKAIQIASTTAFPYYWSARLLLKNDEGGLNFEKNKQYSNYYSWIDSCLNIADTIENHENGKYKIETLKYVFYRYNLHDRKKAKEVERKIKNKDGRFTFKGLNLLVGYNYDHGNSLEMGFTYGLITRTIKPHLFKDMSNLQYFGLSYSRNFDKDMDTYKLYLYSMHMPLRLGICALLITDNKTDAVLFLRPEIGFAPYGVNMFIGYNLHWSGDYFQEFKGFNIGFRYFFNAIGKKEYN